jgi:adenine/guanine/hypoxanthine permease
MHFSCPTYKVALATAFITTIISTVLTFFGPFIPRVVPPAVLLVTIAGVRFAFLGIEQVSNSLAAPIVGYNAVMWSFLGLYSCVSVSVGNWRMPGSLHVILVGSALGWITGLKTAKEVDNAAALVNWWDPTVRSRLVFRLQCRP